VDGFFGINGWEFIVLLLIAMFIFGPDRLPKAISDGVRMLRNLRDLARNATGDLSRELGTEITLEDLHPKTLIRKHLLSEDDERALRKPLEDLYRDVRSDIRGVRGDLDGIRGDLHNGAAKSVKREERAREPRSREQAGSVSPGGPTDRSAAPVRAAYQFDEDAT
jgi:sec-independent protein translocase protein TatB